VSPALAGTTGSPGGPAPSGGGLAPPATALLTGVVVHWHDEPGLRSLVAAWPRDPRFPLLVVDNGSTDLDPAAWPDLVQWLRPGRNLGFGGGANFGVTAARSPFVLLLNPDVEPRPGALDALLAGFAAHPEALGLAPRLLGHDGRGQHRWQLRSLPRPWELLGHALLLPGRQGARTEPPSGAAVEQPAAAALAFRRDRLLALGGFAEDFRPAWFEDVDLARRAARQGERFVYWPAAVLVHRLGSTVPRLGYGAFLEAYDRNLVRYLRRHHGNGWASAARLAVWAGAWLRLLLLPLRRPRRAASRREAAQALVRLARAARSPDWSGRGDPTDSPGDGGPTAAASGGARR
jgi:N-acetylglucosaminyl-diphospho-decaprenol L-rhamnosyltransferase